MRPRSLFLAAVLAAVLLSPGSAGAKAVKNPGPQLVATVPGTDPPVRVTYDVNRIIKGLFDEPKVVGQPAPDTVVIEAPGWIYRPHRRTVRTRPCARVRLHVAVVPAPADPFTLAATAVPEADAMSYETDTHSAEVLGATTSPPTMWMDRQHDGAWKVGAVTTLFSLASWSHRGAFGYETATAEGTILRLDRKACRAGGFSVLPPGLLDFMFPGTPSP